MENAEPQKEHAFLARLVGDWVAVPDAAGGEAGDWGETVRSIGGLWFVAEGKGLMPDGTPGETLMTLGYDPDAGHYVGTWIGSMMARLWIYKGTLEADGRTLTLEAEGPDMENHGKTAIYHDVVTMLDDDRRQFSGSVKLPDGSFKVFMTAQFRRR